jgi:hypothetical protein
MLNWIVRVCLSLPTSTFEKDDQSSRNFARILCQYWPMNLVRFNFLLSVLIRWGKHNLVRKRYIGELRRVLKF